MSEVREKQKGADSLDLSISSDGVQHSDGTEPGKEEDAAVPVSPKEDGSDNGSAYRRYLDGNLKLRRAFMLVWSIVGVIVLVGVGIYLLRVLSIPVSILIWTLVFVFCLRGIVNGLQKKGVNRGVGTTISYIVMFLVLAVIGLLMFSPVFGLNTQFADIVSSIPTYMEAIRSWTDEVYKNYGHWLDNESVQSFVKSAEDSMSSWASSMASGAANAVVDFGTTVANSFLAIGFALVIAFWILLELPALGNEAKRIISPKFYDSAHFLHITFTRIMGGYIKGTLIQCFIIGLGCGILFAILGIPNASALGVITGVMNIIPIIGPWIGGAVAAISAIFVSPITALIAIAGTVVIQQFVYTFVSPKIMQSSVDVHPALTLIAMMIGSAIGGAMSGLLGSLVGMLFAIPAVAVIKSCFIFYFERKTGRKIVSDDGVFFKGDSDDDEEVDPLKDATGTKSNKSLKDQLTKDKDQLKKDKDEIEERIKRDIAHHSSKK